MPAFLAERISGELDGKPSDLVILERFELDGKKYVIAARGTDFDEALLTEGVPDVFTMSLTEKGLDGLTAEEEIRILEDSEVRGVKELPTIYYLDPDGKGERAFEEIIVSEIETDRDEDAWLVVLFDTTNEAIFEAVIKAILPSGETTFRPPEDEDKTPYITLASQAKAIRDMLRRANQKI
jgi:hypothetical protein